MGSSHTCPSTTVRFPAIAVATLLALAFPSCVIDLGDPRLPDEAKDEAEAKAKAKRLVAELEAGKKRLVADTQKAISDTKARLDAERKRIEEVGSAPPPASSAPPVQPPDEACLAVQLSFHLSDMNTEGTDVDRTVALSVDYYTPIDDTLSVGVLGGLSRSDVESEEWVGSQRSEVTRLFAGPGLRWLPDLGGGLRPFASIGTGLEWAHSKGDGPGADTSLGLFFRPSIGLRFETGAGIAFDVGVTMHVSEPFNNSGLGNDEAEAMLTLGLAFKP